MKIYNLVKTLFAAAIMIGISTAKADTLDDFIQLTSGSFDSSAQASQDSRYLHIIWHVVEVLPGQKNERWTYSENLAKDADSPYRQRLTRYRLVEDGSIEAVGFELPNPEKYLGGWRNPEVFEELNKSDLALLGGCPVRLSRTGLTSFEGSTYGQACKNDHRGASYMLSQATIDENGLVNWDRGFNAQGELVWGPPSGGYIFRRIGEQQCNAPVMMVVYGEINDRAGFGKYVGALAQSGLYEKYNAYHVSLTPALAVMEGNPPENRGIVLARFPCIDVAKSFWQSSEYQEIIKLREGAAEFEVSFLRTLPLPDYVQP